MGEGETGTGETGEEGKLLLLLLLSLLLSSCLDIERVDSEELPRFLINLLASKALVAKPIPIFPLPPGL